MSASRLDPVRVAIIGCGNIAGPYAESLTSYAETELVGVADLDPARATALAVKHRVESYPDVAALLPHRIEERVG